MRWFRAVLPFLGILIVAGCSGESVKSYFSVGQVKPASAMPVSHYAAARFAEQAAFGPTPELIAEIRHKGFERWIDDQFAIEPSQIDPSPRRNELVNGPNTETLRVWYHAQFPQLAVAAKDQLRLRATWSLAQFLVVSDRKISWYATLEWINLLQRVAFGNYRDVLKQVTLSPAMGWYLDNLWNRPKSDVCPWCTPNENYARELLQLFSLGVVQLESNGQSKRASNGALAETYTQRDVEELAKALTGWQWVESPYGVMADWSVPMKASISRWDHDWTEKKILGKQIPAGQGAEQDLESVLTILMGHPNIAPFIATRLIQHFVKSNPSPEYVQRVASVFVNNGTGASGDMKAVIKAVLLDQEARRGDDPSRVQPNDGKLREPFQAQVALWRGFGCVALPKDKDGGVNIFSDQMPFSPETVFGFYAPTDTASGTDILSPEQRLLTGNEFQNRLLVMERLRWTPILLDGESALDLSLGAAGCDLAELVAAYQDSNEAFVRFIGPRFFRGAVPAGLQLELARIRLGLLDRRYLSTSRQATQLLAYALLSPYFGATR